MSYNWPEYISVGLSNGERFDATRNDLMGLTLYNLKGEFLNINDADFAPKPVPVLKSRLATRTIQQRRPPFSKKPLTTTAKWAYARMPPK